MSELITRPPTASIDPITETIHGVQVTDPYRWLEDGNSTRTREWIEEQTVYAREYLDGIPGRAPIKERIRRFLEVETYDSILVRKGKLFFRKRLARQEQPCIYVREGFQGQDRLLVDPLSITSSDFGSVKPLAISPNGNVLAYEVRVGGERTARVEFMRVDTAERLPETLPHSYLRAFSFSPDSGSFYYSIEPLGQTRPMPNALYLHRLGEPLRNDQVIFDAGEGQARVGIVCGPQSHLIVVKRQQERLAFEYLLRSYGEKCPARHILSNIEGMLAPQFSGDRIFAITDQGAAPNLRIVEIKVPRDGTADFVEVVPARSTIIQQWMLLRNYIVISYLRGTYYQVSVVDLEGNEVAEIPQPLNNSVRLLAASTDTDEIIFERQSFFESPSIHRYCVTTGEQSLLTQPANSLDQTCYGQRQVWYHGKDGTRIPMFIVGRHELLQAKRSPAILTAYGGFQIAMTPQFSVFVSFLLEKGCLFAIPGIRGGGEFGPEWHRAGQRHNRQTAFNDFVCATRWLIDNEFVDHEKIGIFGGSNSGILMGAAITQAPDLFRAMVCVGPLLDMVRYHLFDTATKWKDEYGTAEDANDFSALWKYSPYHRVEDGSVYPAVMVISGALDQQCNPLHARKMVARLQAASGSARPVILDYHPYRGHSPVLPLTLRIAALVDRMAFLCDQLELT